jgi:hypothetical protein
MIPDEKERIGKTLLIHLGSRSKYLKTMRETQNNGKKNKGKTQQTAKRLVEQRTDLFFHPIYCTYCLVFMFVIWFFAVPKRAAPR